MLYELLDPAVSVVGAHPLIGLLLVLVEGQQLSSCRFVSPELPPGGCQNQLPLAGLKLGDAALALEKIKLVMQHAAGQISLALWLLRPVLHRQFEERI